MCWLLVMSLFDGRLHAVATGDRSSITLREAQRTPQLPAHPISESKSESISIFHPMLQALVQGWVDNQMTQTNSVQTMILICPPANRHGLPSDLPWRDTEPELLQSSCSRGESWSGVHIVEGRDNKQVDRSQFQGHHTTLAPSRA